VPPDIARTAARYALRALGATNKAIGRFSVRLYRALGSPCTHRDSLHAVARRGLDRACARYVDSLRLIADSLSPTERFVLQRLEGLDAWPLQSDSV